MDNLTRRCIAVRTAKKNAKDPEFKKVWQNHLNALLKRSKR
jgi:hypothetical protein